MVVGKYILLTSAVVIGAIAVNKILKLVASIKVAHCPNVKDETKEE